MKLVRQCPGHSRVELVFRPLSRRAPIIEAIRKQIESECQCTMLHCGILDVQRNEVYHFVESGWSKLSFNDWMYQSKYGIDYDDLLYAEHDLSDDEQNRVLERVAMKTESTSQDKYCPIFSNCQTQLFQVVFERSDPGQAINVLRRISNLLVNKLII